MRLYAKANELQRYVDDTLGEKSPIAVRYKEPIRLGVCQPHILVNYNGQYLSFTDCDKAENKVKEIIDMEKNKNVVKLNEAQLRKVVAESVKKVLKESDINNADFDMFPEAVSMRNRNRGIGDDGLNDAKREFRHILNWVAQSISAMSSVHYGNVNYQHTSFEREEERARQAVEAFHKLLDKVSIEYLD